MYYNDIMYIDSAKKTFPLHQKIYVGEPAVISCTSSSRVHWEFNDNSLPSGIVQTKVSLLNTHYFLFIKNTSYIFDGQYSCHGSSQNDDQYMSFVSISHIYVGSE